jgi:hypothetical protein
MDNQFYSGNLPEEILEEKVDELNEEVESLLPGHAIKNEREELPQRGKLKFVGAVLSDDSMNEETVVTVEGGKANSQKISVTHTFELNKALPISYNEGALRLADITENSRKMCDFIGTAPDNSSIIIYSSGIIPMPTNSNFIDGEYYYLSQSQAGQFTNTEPELGIKQLCFKCITIDGTKCLQLTVDNVVHEILTVESDLTSIDVNNKVNQVYSGYKDDPIPLGQDSMTYPSGNYFIDPYGNIRKSLVVINNSEYGLGIFDGNFQTVCLDVLLDMISYLEARIEVLEGGS